MKLATGIGMIFLAMLTMAIYVAGSHGHLMFRPGKPEDWFFWGFFLLFGSIGLTALFSWFKDLFKK